MFQDEPSDTHDAIRWHRGLIEFYRMNLLRPRVGDNPVLCAGHRVELECHERRLAELEAGTPMPAPMAPTPRVGAGG